jgi:HK97 gp10 family phage protein
MQINSSKTKKFDSIRDYLRHFEKIDLQYPKAEKALLEVVGAETEAKAKEMFGHYQRENMGPFDEWEELKKETKDDRVSKGYKPNDPLLREGNLRDSISHSVSNKSVTVGSTSQIMVYQEFGTSRIPPRAVLGPAMFRMKQRIKTLAAKAMFALFTDQVSNIKK